MSFANCHCLLQALLSHCLNNREDTQSWQDVGGGAGVIDSLNKIEEYHRVLLSLQGSQVD